MLNIRLLSPPQTTQGTIRGLWEHYYTEFRPFRSGFWTRRRVLLIYPPSLYFNFTLNFNLTRHKYPRPIHIIFWFPHCRRISAASIGPT